MRSKGGDNRRRAETKGQEQMQNFSAGIFPAGSVVGSSRWKIQVLSPGCGRAFKSFPSRAVIGHLNRSHLGLWVSGITPGTALWLPSMLGLPQHQDVLWCSGVSPALQQINPSAVFPV